MENVQKVLLKIVVAIVVLGFVIICDYVLDKIPQRGLIGNIVSGKYSRMAISYLIGLTVFLFCLKFISRFL